MSEPEGLDELRAILDRPLHGEPDQPDQTLPTSPLRQTIPPSLAFWLDALCAAVACKVVGLS